VPSLTRLGIYHPCGKGIQLCSKEGHSPSPKGDKNDQKIENIFSRTKRPKLIKFGTYYPWVKGIQVCSIKGRGPLHRGDNHKNVKMGWGHLKMLFIRT
jgi:hypothetical protein